jgi:DNA-binding response OmpR family regulator
MLLVEDDRALATALTDLLEGRGDRVLRADNGADDVIPIG